MGRNLRYISVFIVVLFTSATFSMHTKAATLSYKNYSYTVDDEEVTITGYSGSDIDLDIPAEIEGLPVSIIGDDAFSSLLNVKTVKLPNTVHTIGDGAFQNNGLETIQVSENLEKVGHYAFADSYLESIELPNSVRSIGVGAFMETGNLTKVDVGTGVTSIGSTAFGGSAIESIVLPSKIEEIKQATFANTKNLSKITLNNGLEQIGDYAFADSSIRDITIPNTVTEIGKAAFEYSKLQTIKLSTALVEVQESTFEDSELKEVTLPKSIKSIGKYAFNETKLKTIVIPNSVKKISKDAFSSIATLESAYIGNGVTLIGEDAFRENEKLAVVNLGKKLEKIGKSAFRKTGITKLNIPNSVTKINSKAFRSTPKLKEVTLGKGLTIISNAQFENSGIESIVFPDNIKEIKKDAFNGAINLKKVVFNNDLEKIGEGAFSQTSLKDVKIPEKLKELKNSFSQINTLETFSSNKKVSNFEFDKLTDNKKLKSITLPNDILSSTGYSKERFPNLKEVVGVKGRASERFAKKHGLNFKEIMYKLSYQGNGHTGGTAPKDSVQYSEGDYAFIKSKGSLVSKNQTFKSWNTKKDGKGKVYNVESEMMIENNSILYAQWTPIVVVNSVSDKNTSISGTTTPGAKVQIKNGKSIIATGVTNSKGAYTIKIAKQPAKRVLTVAATNSLNNGATKNVTVVDKTPPSKPTVNKVTIKSATIVGKAEAGSVVYLYKGKIKLGSSKANSKGVFTIKIKKEKIDVKLLIHATDTAGNSSAKTTTIVKK